MKLTVEYNAINEWNTFSSGDALTGQVIVEVSKKTNINSLTIKAKGKSNVLWTESRGRIPVMYMDREKYFSQTESLLPTDPTDGQFNLNPGRNTFPFVIQLPTNDMPSSFSGIHGKVLYYLVAKLSRKLRVSSKAKTDFTFVSRADVLLPLARIKQQGSKDKNLTFGSGNISMNIFLEKSGYQQGENITVRAKIVNNSTKKVVPKFIIYQKQSFFAGGKRRVHTFKICKGKQASLPSSSSQTVSEILTVPLGVTPTILNCGILRVEYRLKVILKVSFSKNPEVKLTLLILPAGDGATAKVL